MSTPNILVDLCKTRERSLTCRLNESSVCPQCRRRGEALRHLQHTARLRLRRALQPVQQPEGPGAPLPPDLAGAAQRLAQRAPRIPRLRTDALRTQMNPISPADQTPPGHRQQTNPPFFGTGERKEGREREGERGGFGQNTKKHPVKIETNLTLAATHTSATLELYIFLQEQFRRAFFLKTA